MMSIILYACRFLALALLIQAAGAQTLPPLEIMVGPASGLTAIGSQVAVNDEGLVAFTASDATGSRAFVSANPGTFSAVSNITGSNRTYSGVGLSSEAVPRLVARELV